MISMVGPYLSGFSTATFMACGLFFLKFWRASRDKFFLLFCGAFWLLALERVVGLIVYVAHDNNEVYMMSVRNWLYLFRLAAFALILYGVVEKNRSIEG